MIKRYDDGIFFYVDVSNSSWYFLKQANRCCWLCCSMRKTSFPDSFPHFWLLETQFVFLSCATTYSARPFATVVGERVLARRIKDGNSSFQSCILRCFQVRTFLFKTGLTILGKNYRVSKEWKLNTKVWMFIFAREEGNFKYLSSPLEARALPSTASGSPATS